MRHVRQARHAGFRCLTAAEINAAYLAANGITPGVNPNAIAFLADKTQRYVANDTTVGDGINTGGFRFNAPTPTTFDTYVLKFDFNLTNSQTLFVRGNYQEDNIGQLPAFPDTPAPSIWYHPKGFALGHSWTASSRMVNRFTYGLTRAAFTRQGDQNGNNVSFSFHFRAGCDHCADARYAGPQLRRRRYFRQRQSHAAVRR